MNAPTQIFSNADEQGQASAGIAASLVRRIGEGDRFAEEELATVYFRRVFAIAVGRTRDRDAAKDLAQEILMAVLQALRAKRIRDEEKLTAFMQGTARNLINNYLRNRARHPESDMPAVEPCGPDLVQQLESAERQRLLRQELSRCSVSDQQILRLSLVDGYSLAQVAKRLHLSYEAVRARKSRLIRKIARHFAEVSQTGPIRPH
jgi:RNA polymerase sigma factor (sigma-70 family)